MGRGVGDVDRIVPKHDIIMVEPGVLDTAEILVRMEKRKLCRLPENSLRNMPSLRFDIFEKSLRIVQRSNTSVPSKSLGQVGTGPACFFDNQSLCGKCQATIRVVDNTGLIWGFGNFLDNYFHVNV